MKRPLLTRIFSLISDRSSKTLTATILCMVLFAANAQAQTTFTQSECFCLDNATTSDNGQYREVITINSGITGQTWRLMNPLGFFNPLSLAPPASPIPYLNNTLIPETAPGVYSIAAIRVTARSWSIVVTNGSEVQAMKSDITCTYPSVTISGDVAVCPVSSELYTIPVGATSVVWTLTGGGTLSTPTASSVNVNWSGLNGTFKLSVSGKLTSYPTQPNACNFTSSKLITIANPIPATTIRGDFGNCVNARETYTLSATPDQLSGVSWGVFLDAAGTMPSGILGVGSVNSQTFQWPASPGTYYIRVTGFYAVGSNSCPFTSVQRVDIVNEALRPLACLNQVQISMNPSCELYFTADQLLQDQPYLNSSFDIKIRDIEKDTIIPAGTLGYKYINKILEIKIIHECSGNSCWGYAKIEDKSIPQLLCPDDVTIECVDLGNFNVTGFPDLPVGAEQLPIANMPGKWLLKGYDKCSDVTLSFKDEALTDLCVGPYSSIITRTWLVTDNTGNTSSCLQTINVLRADIDDVIFPSNYDGVTGPYPSLEACGNWIKIPDGDFKGNPSPETTGYPVGTLCLKSSVTFTDVKLRICDKAPDPITTTYKIVRKWKVIDHCTGVIREKNQFVTVMDTQKPVISCPADITGQLNNLGQPILPIKPAAVIVAKEHSCGAEWSVIPPATISDCSATTWEVHFLFADSQGRPPVNGNYVKKSGTTEVTGSYPNFKILNLPFGRTWLRYTVTDICGNFSECFTEVEVIDNQPPTPVCDKNTIIAIGSEGMSFAGVLTFDDGSHDNCALDYMKVRRMDENPSWASLPKNNEIKFTCNDIGTDKVIMVELGVWDKGGLTNSCMVEVRVQDNIFPELTIPANVTANCYEDFTTLTRFGTATVTDNCNDATITTERIDALNECGLGTITRKFTAKDTYGNTVVKSQVITVGNDKKFNGQSPFNDIDWPDNYVISNGCVNSINPDNFPVANARPRYIRNTQCAQLASSYEDIIFNFTDEACTKILRKWTVIDWCQKVPQFPEIGQWSSTQIIMINNTSAPNIQKGCNAADLTITQINSCLANIKVTAQAEDDCTDDELLRWTYSIDEGNNGTLEVNNATGNVVNRDFAYGTHKIIWSVKDGCNNVKTCPNIFTLVDDKKPSPYCISELVTVIMPTSREVTIWASDFDLGATDNCSVGKTQIIASFSPTNKNDISRVIKCSDLEDEARKEFTFKVYSIDQANNSDFCTVNLVVQDNGNSCGTNPPPANRVSLQGSVYNESDVLVQDVKLELISNQAEFPRSVATDAVGKFTFSELPMYNDYSLSPDKNDNPLNGVSTLDMVMIQRHILGIAPFDSPYKLIAADINNSEQITAADLVELRKLILGIQTSFLNNKSWRFVDVAYQFPDKKHPFPFIDYVEMSGLDHDVAGLDFMAVKIGDVNGSAKANATDNSNTSSRSIKTLHADKISGKAGEEVDIKIYASDLNGLLGMQMTFSIDTKLCEILDISSPSIRIKDENLGFGQFSSGLVHFSWNNNEAVNVKDQIINIRARLLKNINSEDLIGIDRTYLTPELYTNDGSGIQIHNVKLESGNLNPTLSDKFELFQNVPNPFNTTTMIGFNLPQNDMVTFKVFDLTGKLVHQTKGQYAKGYNTINIDVNTLNINGVLYYQLDTDSDSATRKMIVIK
ncbi:MAG: T9SS type A sorting domain-containing protein [Saprospiraceae bacterium]|nr:T9SS type A sorting domain-containing protein [Saprospiraceae bacterium]